MNGRGMPTGMPPYLLVSCFFHITLYFILILTCFCSKRRERAHAPRGRRSAIHDTAYSIEHTAYCTRYTPSREPLL